MRLPSYIVGAIRAVLMPALLMAGTGCTVIRKQYDTPLPDLSDMQNGASTYADVLAAYGPPLAIYGLLLEILPAFHDVDVHASFHQCGSAGRIARERGANVSSSEKTSVISTPDTSTVDVLVTTIS